LPSKYDQIDVDAMVEQHDHLDSSQQEGQKGATEGVKLLFSKMQKIDFEIKPDATPVHCKAFPVPVAHKKVFVDECINLWSKMCWNLSDCCSM
jgi:hypothetical protein